MSNSLKEAYEYVCNTFFPRFDRQKEWIAKYSSKIPGQGLCDRNNKIIFVERIISDIELLLILIHEICHAVTSNDHGRKWQNRLLKAAELAAKIGQKELSKILKDEIKMYQNTVRTYVEVVYNSIEDCLIDLPQSSYATIIKYVAKYYGFYPEEFERRFKRCRKVYEEQKRILS